MPTDKSRWISWIWRVALLVVFSTQLFMLGLRTSAGARIIPRVLLKAHIVRPRQAAGLLNSVERPGGGAVPALAQQIQQSVPADCTLEVVWNGPQLPLEGGELAYKLYPRRFSQRTGIAGDRSGAPCRIDWRSEADLTLSTPGSVWQYQGSGASAQ
jgi:hypothetical protein